MEAAILKDVVTPVVGIAALLFTVETFWWNNWRRGSLSVDIPRTYGAVQNESGIRLLLPLAIKNTGAIPIAVTALRLKIGDTRQDFVPYTVARPSMKLDSKTPWEFASNFMVAGRAIEIRFCEFVSQSLTPLTPGHNPVAIKALEADRGDWTQVGAFELLC
jgi:hypothetical protein